LSSDNSRNLSEWWSLGKQRLSEMLSINEFAMSHDLVGMTINPQSIQLLKISSVNDQHEVEYFNVIKLPDGLMVNNEIKNCTAIADILKDSFNHSGLKTKNIALTIPRSSAIVKNITVDHRLQPDEIESKVWIEANRLFPNLIGDIYLDFSIMGPSPQDSSQVEVILVACRKDQVKPYLEIMRLAGLKARIVDINYYALERALTLVHQQFPQDKTIAMLNIGYRLIDLLIVHVDKLIYTHELSYDGRSLLQLVEKIDQHDKTQNEQSSETLDETKTNEILKNTLGLHLKHAMQFFYSSRPNIRIEKIILSGDCSADIPGFDNFIQQEVGKEVVLANPFKAMKIKSSVDKSKLAHYAPSLMLCCGVALSKFTTQ
jgi:type IV pilus assembly protein PilM